MANIVLIKVIVVHFYLKVSILLGVIRTEVTFDEVFNVFVKIKMY